MFKWADDAESGPGYVPPFIDPKGPRCWITAWPEPGTDRWIIKFGPERGRPRKRREGEE